MRWNLWDVKFFKQINDFSIKISKKYITKDYKSKTYINNESFALRPSVNIHIFVCLFNELQLN